MVVKTYVTDFSG